LNLNLNLPFTLDDGAGAKASFGIIVLQTDETLEMEFRQLFDEPGLALYHSRIPSDAEVNTGTLNKMRLELPRAAALLPTVRKLDVVAYACTSGATVIGADNVAAAIHTAHPGARTSDPITAVMAACNHLSIRKLGFVTPYVAEVSAAMRRLLEAAGFTISAFGSFGQHEDAVIARITPQSLYDAICSLGADPDVEAVFAACTNLRSFEIIEKAEAAIGKPVITSNQALAWHMLTLANVTLPHAAPGRLFKL
jgi:maleate isomerase